TEPLPTLDIGVMHERVGTPSTCTVQAPQKDMPQPNLVPLRSSSSRSTHRRGVSAVTSTMRFLPFTVIEKAMRNSLVSGMELGRAQILLAQSCRATGTGPGRLTARRAAPWLSPAGRG